MDTGTTPSTDVMVVATVKTFQPFADLKSYAVEMFENGGQGIGYADNSPGNTGGAFRQGDVDIETSPGGGANVGWMGAGEWMKYTVTVAAAGSYRFEFRVASEGAGGTLRVQACRVSGDAPGDATGADRVGRQMAGPAQAAGRQAAPGRPGEAGRGTTRRRAAAGDRRDRAGRWGT